MSQPNMAKITPWVVVGTMMLALNGCASASVQTGAAIGALSGVALGAGVGVLITDKDLLGDTPRTKGDISLEPGPTIAASMLVGAVFGSLVGAMLGHAGTEKDELSAPAHADNAEPRAF